MPDPGGGPYGFQPQIPNRSRATEKADKIKRGIGIGTTAYFGGSLIYPNSSSVIVKLNDDASVSLMTGALDIGQGCETVLSQIVAEELSVPLEEVQVYASDTETTPVDIGSWISGLTYVTGNAAKKAAAQAMNKLLAVAAEELQTEVKDLTARNKEIFVTDTPERRLSYPQVLAASIAKNKGNSIIGEGHFRTMKDEPTRLAWPRPRAAGRRITPAMPRWPKWKSTPKRVW